MFKGNYGFFDYKYNIEGYNGQDYGGSGRLIYFIAALVIVTILLIVFRKATKQTVLKYLKIMGIVFTALYIIKTTWESYYDITTNRGFNTGILPFDTCSIIMWAALLAGFGKGKLKILGESWLATGGVVGGLATIPFLKALNYYPFFTFGAFYSMLWHIVMLFTGLWLFVTGYVKPNFKTLLYGFIFHIIISAVVIILDYAFNWDFMLYIGAGGVPFVESLADGFAKVNMQWLTTIIMVICYFAAFCVVVFSALLVEKLISLCRKKHSPPDNTDKMISI